MITTLEETIKEAASLAVYSSRRSASAFEMLQEVIRQKDARIKELEEKLKDANT